LHITPLEDVLQIRPSFKTLHNNSNWESVEDLSDDEGREAKSEKVEQIRMKRRENDKTQSAKSISFMSMRAQEDNEAFQRLKVYPIGKILDTNENCNQLNDLKDFLLICDDTDTEIIVDW
jgi:hypothetical protein